MDKLGDIGTVFQAIESVHYFQLTDNVHLLGGELPACGPLKMAGINSHFCSGDRGGSLANANLS